MLGALQITEGPDKGRSHFFGRQKKVTIGRAVDAAVCLKDAQASRMHCEVYYEGERVMVSDAGSSTGTWVNGNQIWSPQELRAGDVILVGQTKLTFQWVDTDQNTTEAWQPAAE